MANSSVSSMTREASCTRAPSPLRCRLAISQAPRPSAIPQPTANSQPTSVRSRTSTASSGEAAGFLEREARAAREDLRGVALAEVAEKIGFPAPIREEGRVHLGVVEAGHRARIQPERARRDDQGSALQRAVAGSHRVVARLLFLALEKLDGIRPERKRFRQV